jgi:hypothetical protein
MIVMRPVHNPTFRCEVCVTDMRRWVFRFDIHILLILYYIIMQYYAALSAWQ